MKVKMMDGISEPVPDSTLTQRKTSGKTITGCFPTSLKNYLSSSLPISLQILAYSRSWGTGEELYTQLDFLLIYCDVSKSDAKSNLHHEDVLIKTYLITCLFLFLFFYHHWSVWEDMEL